MLFYHLENQYFTIWFLDNFLTNFRQNSTRKKVRWFEELINLNHLTIFITEFDQKQKFSKKNSAISLALIAARSVFHLTLRACETLRSAREIASVALSAERERHTENVFHIVFILRRCETHSQCVSLAPPREPLKLSLLHSIVFHIALNSTEPIKKSSFIISVVSRRHSRWRSFPTSLKSLLCSTNGTPDPTDKRMSPGVSTTRLCRFFYQ